MSLIFLWVQLRRSKNTKERKTNKRLNSALSSKLSRTPQAGNIQTLGYSLENIDSAGEQREWKRSIELFPYF
jgi:hypothetical protein